MTWNIHRGCGQDGRIDPVRTVDALLAEVCLHGTMVLALTEADAERPPHAGFLDLARIEGATGLRHLHRDAALRWHPGSHGFLGTVLFLSPEITVSRAALLDLPGRCHRGAVVVEATLGAAPFRIVATHLSLGQPLRIAQMRTIGQHLFRHPRMQTILLGDLNEWRPWGGLALSRRLTGLDLHGPARPTFPARRPLLPLDRILTDRAGAIRNPRVLDGPGIRSATDHRPLAATVILEN